MRIVPFLVAGAVALAGCSSSSSNGGTAYAPKSGGSTAGAPATTGSSTRASRSSGELVTPEGEKPIGPVVETPGGKKLVQLPSKGWICDNCKRTYNAEGWCCGRELKKTP